ncbi:hypothetical protein O6H91_09G089500 [Diphasiastrum complanatum]|uniref:Uncharacterized protein n=1 Tax=Diphasiastrum complanatum TaxID=34168 RepID=A0ACC2CRX5_DIPCM|nr:hypothetical protein O6H91_09G089500 [Diphasiastrum complanatum]
MQEMIGGVAEALGREVKVYAAPAAIRGGESTATSWPSEEEVPDDFYEFTAADYATLNANKKEDIYLKTKKNSRQGAGSKEGSKDQGHTIHVHFPDGFVVEATFKSTETISDLMELVRKSILRSELPFYLCKKSDSCACCSNRPYGFLFNEADKDCREPTPRKRPLKNMQQNMMDASFTPGANIYYVFSPPQDVEVSREGPYLGPEVQELRDLYKLSDGLSENVPNAIQLNPIETIKAPVTYSQEWIQ